MADMIQVNPAQLRKTADNIGQVHTNLRNQCHMAKSQIDGLRNVWTGDAAAAYQQSFQVLLDRCSESLLTIERMVNALYDSADAYEKNEKAVQQEAAKMPKLPTNTMR